MLKSSSFFAALLTAMSVFCISACRADLPVFTVLHSFGPAKSDGKDMFRQLNSDGASPSDPLIQGHDGRLYGATGTGGVNGLGTLYKTNTDGTGFTVLHTFSPPNSSKRTVNTDGSSPTGTLVQDSSGKLYGAAETGGANGSGTLFKMNTDGSGFTVLHLFDGLGYSGLNKGGSLPTGITLGKDGLLYGAARGGGQDGQGVIYSVEVTGKNFRILHTFSGDGPDNRSNRDGASPATALVTKNGTVFYGTTMFGGNRDNTGVIYRFLVGGKDFQVMHNFEHQPDLHGSDPVGTLAIGTDGFVYGTAQQEGNTDGGAIFKMSADGTIFIVLHSFSQTALDSANGSLPAGPLVFGPGGRLYGLTGYGGASGMGTLFKVTTDGAKFFTLHDFSPAEGEHSLTGLTQGQDGSLYGVCAEGGANGTGTIFRITFPAA